MQHTLVILAAGVGSRYGGLKQLTPLGPGGEAILEYSVYDALRAGFSRIVLVVRPESEATFRARFEAGMARRVPLTYVHQTLDDLPDGFVRPPDRVKPWGTGQAVLAAEAEIEGAFAVINADDFYGAGSFAELARFLSAEHPGPTPTVAIVGFQVAQTLSAAGPVSRALCRLDEAGLVRQIVEIKEVWRCGGRIVYRDAAGAERSLDGGELVSMNMWGFTRQLFPALRCRFRSFLARAGEAGDAELLLPDAVQSLVCEQRARVEALRGSGPWCGITFPEDEARVTTLLSTLVTQGHYPKELWACLETKR